MNKKTFFKGNLVMSKNLYNYLYSVFAFIIWVIVSIAAVNLFSLYQDKLPYWLLLPVNIAIIIFVFYKLFSDRNYVQTVESGQQVEFVNGFDNWHETHYQIVRAINYNEDIKGTITNNIASESGTGELMRLAETLTNEFEALHKEREWDGEWFDEIDEFLEGKL